MTKINKIEIFKRIMSKAVENGYTGPSYEYELGRIIDGTNICAVIFREDFAKAIWGDKSISLVSQMSAEEMKNSSMLDAAMRFRPEYKKHLVNLVLVEDKWKYLEENALN